MRIPAFLISIKKLKRAGTKIKVNMVEVTKPPNTILPIPRYNSEPAPEDTTKGKRPNVVVSILIMIGRNRVRTDSAMAAIGSSVDHVLVEEAASWPSRRFRIEEIQGLMNNQNSIVDHHAEQDNKSQHRQHIHRLIGHKLVH